MAIVDILAANPHNNIIRFIGRFGRNDLTLSFIVMELAAGDLYQLLQETIQGQSIWVALLPQYCRHLIQGIARGVQHLFSLGISHGDIKLENVLVTYAQGSTGAKDYMHIIPKLNDFNNSKMEPPGSKSTISLHQII